MSKPSDRLRLLRKEQSEVVASYYASHHDELLALVSSRLGGGRHAEDLVQDVFLRLLTTKKMITPQTLPALVFTMVRNLITDYYRRRATRDAYEHYIKGTCCEEVSAESVYSVREIISRIEHGLARLPEDCREIYRLHLYDGMKVGEISQCTGESYKRVEHHLGRARKSIRLYLRRYA